MAVAAGQPRTLPAGLADAAVLGGGYLAVALLTLAGVGMGDARLPAPIGGLTTIGWDTALTTRHPALPPRPAAPAVPPPAASHRSTAPVIARIIVARPTRFTGWFTRTAAPTVNRWRGSCLPKQTPGAALTAA